MTTLTASFAYLDQIYHVEYEFERLNDEETLGLLAQAREAAGSGRSQRLYYRAVVRPIVGWDLTDRDGRPLPVSVDALLPPLPAGLAAAIRTAMTTHAEQYERETTREGRRR
jgi:hypothetical protein